MDESRSPQQASAGSAGVPGLLIVAGEVSGDIHAGNMLLRLREIAGDLHAFGIGGERLEAAGLDLVARTSELSHMGLFEVVRELPRLRRILQRLVRAATLRRPAVAVLVDSPDFNLRLAKRLSAIGVPVVLYVSPQLWAWRRRRVRTVRRLARKVLCILPFEVSFYERHGVPAVFVGHPLVDDIESEGLKVAERPPHSRRLALLPGSRSMEVRQLLPGMLDAVSQLPGELIEEVVLIAAPGMETIIGEILESASHSSRVRVVAGAGRRRQLAGAALAWTASGTATLECALLGVPMVVGYRLHPLSYMLARTLVRVPHIALVNLIAGRRAVPELVQSAWKAESLIAHTRQLLAGGGADQKVELQLVRERLGPAGASRRAAEEVARLIRDERAG